MNTSHEYYEEESGVTFLYTFDEKYGWNCEMPQDLTREQQRYYISNSIKYWPETPDEYKEQVEKSTNEMLHYIRNYRIDNEI